MSRTPYIIPKKQAEVILREALLLCRRHFVDELDCKKSFIRVKSELTFDEVLEIAFKCDKVLFNFIHRDMSFLPQEYLDDDGKNPNRNYWDVGLSTISSNEYGKDFFIFIELEEDVGFELIKKYNLKQMK